MGKVYLLLSLLQLVIIIKGMVLHDGFLDLDYLFQKSLRCSHPKENYQMILREKLYQLVWKLSRKQLFNWLLMTLKANESQYFLMLKKCLVQLK